MSATDQPVVMKLNLNKTTPRVAFQFGRRSGLRNADELVEQLTEQLRKARQEIAELRYGLAQERHAAAARAVIEAFARLQRSPETVLH